MFNLKSLLYLSLILPILLFSACTQTIFLDPSAGTCSADAGNTGNGTCTVGTVFWTAVSETITMTSSGAGPTATFAVSGSVSGSLGNISSGSAQTVQKSGADYFTVTLSDGATPYASSDEFTVVLTAGTELQQSAFDSFDLAEVCKNGCDSEDVALETKTLRLNGATSGNVDFASPDTVSTPYEIVWPDAEGSAGQIFKVDSIASNTVTLEFANETASDPDALVDSMTNLGLTYASGRLSVTAADGSALSGSNPGFVRIASVTSGEVVVLRIEENKFFDDDAAATSDIDNEEFGATTARAWGSDRPFFGYACNSDDTDDGVEIAVSPNPSATRSPATTNIGYHNAPAATPSDLNFFFLTASDVTTSHDVVPCTRIFTIHMQMSSGDDWTVQPLASHSGTGIGRFPSQQYYALPTGQMGANTGNYIVSAGTSPTWATMASVIARYRIREDGTVTYFFSTNEAGNATNGSGTGAVSVALPYKPSAMYGTSTFSGYLPVGGYLAAGATTATLGVLFMALDTDVSVARIFDTGLASLLENDFSSAANDDLSFQVTYKAFD